MVKEQAEYFNHNKYFCEKCRKFGCYVEERMLKYTKSKKWLFYK